MIIVTDEHEDWIEGKNVVIVLIFLSIFLSLRIRMMPIYVGNLRIIDLVFNFCNFKGAYNTIRDWVCIKVTWF